MLGHKHEPQCDCNIEQHVSGKSEKCNYRYGNSRARAKEKREARAYIEETRQEG